MDTIKDTVNNLLQQINLRTSNPEAILAHIAMNIYESDYKKLREKESFGLLPVLLQDIILLINFDIELQMNGIIGFLENSSGEFFEETIQALYRIHASEDFKIMSGIKDLLLLNHIDLRKIREDMNSLYLYQVSTSSDLHGRNMNELLDVIATQADGLYLYRKHANIFDDHVYRYVEANKESLMVYLR
ncbi:DMP19 family protein [Paenibacillus sacheonensis]|uniref:DUF4375 domain-containing protein n=1 Tax=Paenibacillus sacheonensis TaxID=742054 RepID=A0A7X4YSN9_9BACL|nr:DMP19 family protein [Paenibacillus sacheonensis]MBM7568151.1 hypothetical protein [Paenibacillus sacheonensis]NBC71847.1 DUF4375 domain-containing protein [Paenibacillus sacheonensis]